MHTILEHVKKAYDETQMAVIKETSLAYGLYDFVAAIICERNGFNPKEIDEYISGTKRPKNFVGIKDIEKAVSLIAEAMSKNEKIRIVGDYDV